jgi:hypothetical protein
MVLWHQEYPMTRKMTFSLDEATAISLERSADRLSKPKSWVVREAIRTYGESLGKLSDEEQARLLAVFDEVVSCIPERPAQEVDEELSELRRARREGGRPGSGTE